MEFKLRNVKKEDSKGVKKLAEELGESRYEQVGIVADIHINW